MTDSAPSQTQAISCAEFQERLPEFFASGNGIPDDPTYKAHLDTCDQCSALVRDLQYIAQFAGDLLKEDEDKAPSEEVWNKIERELKQDTGNPAN